MKSFSCGAIYKLHTLFILSGEGSDKSAHFKYFPNFLFINIGVRGGRMDLKFILSVSTSYKYLCSVNCSELWCSTPALQQIRYHTHFHLVSKIFCHLLTPTFYILLQYETQLEISCLFNYVSEHNLRNYFTNSYKLNVLFSSVVQWIKSLEWSVWFWKVKRENKCSV